jgi:hypothetical protein
VWRRPYCGGAASRMRSSAVLCATDRRQHGVSQPCAGWCPTLDRTEQVGQIEAPTKRDLAVDARLNASGNQGGPRRRGSRYGYVPRASVARRTWASGCQSRSSPTATMIRPGTLRRPTRCRWPCWCCSRASRPSSARSCCFTTCSTTTTRRSRRSSARARTTSVSSPPAPDATSSSAGPASKPRASSATNWHGGSFRPPSTYPAPPAPRPCPAPGPDSERPDRPRRPGPCSMRNCSITPFSRHAQRDIVVVLGSVQTDSQHHYLLLTR